MRTQFAVRIFAFHGGFLAVRQHAVAHPCKCSGIARCCELIAMPKIENEALAFATDRQHFDAVKIRVNDFDRTRITGDNFCTLLGAEEKTLVAEHLAVEAALRVGVAEERMPVARRLRALEKGRTEGCGRAVGLGKNPAAPTESEIRDRAVEHCAVPSRWRRLGWHRR